MDPNRKTDRILGEFRAVTAGARRPAQAPRPGRSHGAWSALGLAGAGLLAAGLVVAFAALGPRTSTGVGGAGPSASAAPSELAVAPSPSPLESPVVAPTEPAATPSPTPKPTATPRPTPTPTPDCASSELSARIVSWEGAAGSRIATMELTSTTSHDCVLVTSRVRLVDGAGHVLAITTGAHPAPDITVQSGGKLSTLVQVSNVCANVSTPPVTLEFEVRSNDWLRAQPVSPTDETVPPCNGPGQPAEIQMHPWSKA